MASCSDDEYDCDPRLVLQKTDNKEIEDAMMKKINFAKLASGEAQSFEFDVPETVETDGFKKRVEQVPLICDEGTCDRISLKIWNKGDMEVLNQMMGDFSEIEGLMDCVLSDGSLKKVIVKCGTGKMVQMNQLVSAHMIMSVEFMDDLLESTYKDRRPKRFRVGKGEVIRMIDSGIQTMRVGEVAKFLGTSEVAFGKLGVPLMGGNSIPPDARILAQIEVLDVRLSDNNESIAFMSAAERGELGFDELYKYVFEKKEEGNREFNEGDPEVAKVLYREALDVMKDMEPIPMTSSEQIKFIELFQIVLINLACLYFKLEKYKMALKYAEHSASEHRGSSNRRAKSHFWCGKALYELGRYPECVKHLKKANDLKWEDKDIKGLLQKAEAKVKEEIEMEKTLCARMMSASIN